MAYIGPDVLMPVASALTAVAGVLILFWHRTVALVRRMGGALASLFKGSPKAP